MTGRLLSSAILQFLILCLAAGWSPAAAQGDMRSCSSTGKLYVFFVDRTSIYDANDTTDLTSGLEKIYYSLHSGDRFIVQTITEDLYATPPLFDGCRPVCPEFDENWWVALNCDTKRQKEADRRFQLDVISMLRKIRDRNESYKSSKLFEFITQFTEEYKQVSLSRVYMFSDLLQNSETIKPQDLLGADEHVLGKLKAMNLTPSLAGASVRVFGVGRWHDAGRRGLTLEERRRLTSLWEKWLKSGGATEVLISQRFYAISPDGH